LVTHTSSVHNAAFGGRPDGRTLRCTFAHSHRPADPTDPGIAADLGIRRVFGSSRSAADSHCYPRLRKEQFISSAKENNAAVNLVNYGYLASSSVGDRGAVCYLSFYSNLPTPVCTKVTGAAPIVDRPSPWMRGKSEWHSENELQCLTTLQNLRIAASHVREPAASNRTVARSCVGPARGRGRRLLLDAC
jgi:hypothetical protein